MKRLIIHPLDDSTTFLTHIYANLPNKTVITGGISQQELRKHILNHEQVMMLGHGDLGGLYSVGQFPDSSYRVIDETMVDVLRGKSNIFIWCYASLFMKRYSLNGFGSGMFISEKSEAIFLNYWYVSDDTIDESNHTFSNIVSKYLDEEMDVLFKNVKREYGKLARTNPIAKYNWERLFMGKPEKYELDALVKFLSEIFPN